MASTKKNTYTESPIGVAVHPWLNKPDTKFNQAGLYHVELRLEGLEAQALKDRIAKLSEEAFEEGAQEFTAGERKKWSVYYPFTEEEDEDGNPTGAVLFDFKQNATITLKDKSVKKVQIDLFDAEGNEITTAIYSGSKVRVMWSARAIPMKSLKQIGVRLDFCAVQLIELGSGSGSGGKRFGKVDGGYVAKPGDASEDGGSDTTTTDAGGDY